MSDVRCLFRPSDTSYPLANGAKFPPTKEGREARRALGEYLDAHLQRPLHFNDTDADQRVETALATMTIAERVFLEIDMQRSIGNSHTCDYDPLRY